MNAWQRCAALRTTEKVGLESWDPRACVTFAKLDDQSSNVKHWSREILILYSITQLVYISPSFAPRHAYVALKPRLIRPGSSISSFLFTCAQCGYILIFAPWNGLQMPLTLSLMLVTGLLNFLFFSPVESLNSSAFSFTPWLSRFRTHIDRWFPLM